ncbi:aldehyde dehydrogenase family protein [Halomonas daqingensis]|uniref:Aldehyde dehydrogenase family protein n=1 Tax=Billgrantia desiderata TaxID=52021 RepID=A0AAW4YRF5_9GAMM|nr:aldehyde dehydrogenase family protein [Halomonas desiderata]MCE8042650.1 aldehyde dehydrogenase family protein [Halomonas desiderata]MCE8047225.1 aldehyde dehydrogenase family protein [Halomonas desiderata]MCE8050546.1 aldehyde dehydrogenase family protein [Halomonas desiderata]OUE43923.1 aldehyde dehydrogenase family protein [Halomonas desiderata SP1]
MVTASDDKEVSVLDNATQFLNYIDGQWVASGSGATFENRNPADQDDLLGLFQASGVDDARRAIAAADRAFTAWRETPISQRAKILNRAADYLMENVEQFARELTREEGKLLANSRDEVTRSAQTLRFYAVEGQTITGETFPQDDAKMTVYTQREPLGVATIITPWNFPISIPARKIAPALITGNTVVFKPSSDAPLIGYRLAEALHHAGVPAGVFNFITGAASAIGEEITANPVVKAISFTGSTAAGERIHRAAAMATRTQMELGGKNPLIVLEDADIDTAVDLTVKGGFSLTGQACTGTSRVLIARSRKQEYLTRLVEQVKTLKIGNGMSEGIQIGPLATRQQLDTVLGYVETGRKEATHVYGGEHLTEGDYAKGFYVTPAIFSDVTQEMRIAREEIFGPVVAVIEVDGYEDAIAKANDTPYGLAAGLVTKNFDYIQRFPLDIQAGTVKINRTTTGNLVNAPFGGLKQSSTSTFRESGRAGLDFFTQTKTVYLGR